MSQESLPSGLAREVVEALEDRKAVDLRILDLRKVASYTDLLVLCSGTSSTHVQALVKSLDERVGEKPVYRNSSPDDSWWILDYIDVVVHVFQVNMRIQYDIETLWSDASTIDPGDI